jgi:hypothetical protein
MKKLFGLWSPKEARRLHAPIQNITSSNPSVDSSTAKYVIFKTRMHSKHTQSFSKIENGCQNFALPTRTVQGGTRKIALSSLLSLHV